MAFNTALAQKRAESFKNYLQHNLDMPQDDKLFELYNGREDWDGLRRLVAASDMEYRQEALDIIDSYTIEQEERKTKLKQLAGGKPYAYMAGEFLPVPAQCRIPPGILRYRPDGFHRDGGHRRERPHDLDRSRQSRKHRGHADQ